MNTIVSFEIAKLLKEKGFNNKVSHYWNYNGEVLFSYKPKTDPINYTMAPAIAEVVMWLYDEHGVWIEGMHCGTFNDFTFKVSRLNKKNIKKEPHYMHDLGKGFNSPTDAYRAAIEYALNNLI